MRLNYETKGSYIRSAYIGYFFDISSSTFGFPLNKLKGLNAIPVILDLIL